MNKLLVVHFDSDSADTKWASTVFVASTKHEHCMFWPPCGLVTNRDWATYSPSGWVRKSQEGHVQFEVLGPKLISGWWFGTCFIFAKIGNNHPNWLSYFSEGFKPPTRIWSYFSIGLLDRNTFCGFPFFRQAKQAPCWRVSRRRCAEPHPQRIHKVRKDTGERYNQIILCLFYRIMDILFNHVEKGFVVDVIEMKWTWNIIEPFGSRVRCVQTWSGQVSLAQSAITGTCPKCPSRAASDGHASARKNAEKTSTIIFFRGDVLDDLHLTYCKRCEN